VLKARYKRILKRDRKALFSQFDRAAAKARTRIREHSLQEAYGLEF
jgi:hypothetical protein